MGADVDEGGCSTVLNDVGGSEPGPDVFGIDRGDAIRDGESFAQAEMGMS